MKKFLSLLIATSFVVFAMTSCTSGNENKNEDKPVASTSSENNNKPGLPTEAGASSGGSQASSEEPVGKYANMETYEKDGVKYGKTDSGKEVAISGENMQKLLEEYTKVQGTGSDKERDLLDQLQVILDNANTGE